MQNKVVLIGGGVRSGKSAFALTRAMELGRRRVFLATAEALDDDMRERAVRHRAERGTAFETRETPRELVPALRALQGQADVVVIDCLTLWLSNLLLDELSAQQIEARVHELCTELAQRRFSSVIVTNEVGLGVVPEHRLARTFRDLTGRAHQHLGAVSDELYFGVMGQVLRLKPGPIELVGATERT